MDSHGRIWFDPPSNRHHSARFVGEPAGSRDDVIELALAQNRINARPRYLSQNRRSLRRRFIHEDRDMGVTDETAVA